MANGVLMIFAHPDDETFSSAGTIRSLVERGVRVALVTATRGQAGSAGTPPLVERDALPQTREAELRAACAVLGVHAVEVLDYQDKQLADAPIAEIRATLVGAIRRERPRVVITFDPAGVNGHRDHIAISAFAMDAVTAAADPRYHPAQGPAHTVQRVVWPSPVLPWDEWRPDVLPTVPGVDFLVDITPWRDTKIAALQQHRTQHASVDRYWFAPAESVAMLSRETFRFGWGAPPSVRPAGDIFEGLIDVGDS
jgi:N-acetylglucosamine malate deacetylase 2